MDQLGAMRAFVRVVQVHSFSAAAREQNSTQATISKKVAALENQLGVKLLSRTSRELALTDAGQEYYDKCVLLLSELDEVEASIREQITLPKGTIRVAAPVAFGRLVIAPILNEFIQRYPDLKIDLTLSDQHVDLVAQGIDVAFRARKLEDSALIARHLFDNPMLLLASPSYLEQNVYPETPQQLTNHNCLVYSQLKSLNIWHFNQQDEEIAVPVQGTIQSDSGDALLEMALTGAGVVQLPIWMVKKQLECGELVQILTDYQGQNLPFNAVYLQNRHVPLKVRTFIDYMKEKLVLLELNS